MKNTTFVLDCFRHSNASAPECQSFILLLIISSIIVFIIIFIMAWKKGVLIWHAKPLNVVTSKADRLTSSTVSKRTVGVLSHVPFFGTAGKRKNKEADKHEKA